MFGISPAGWIHTLGSLPAVPLAAYMFCRYGRIVPRSKAGLLYLTFMSMGALTVFLVAHQPVSNVIGVITLMLLAGGYGIAFSGWRWGGAVYVETILLSLSAFFLMVPTVSEVLRRVPDGHPIVTDLHSPLLLGAQGLILLILIVGVTAQLWSLRRKTAAGHV